MLGEGGEGAAEYFSLMHQHPQKQWLKEEIVKASAPPQGGRGWISAVIAAFCLSSEVVLGASLYRTSKVKLCD